jgi:hypothetical protein
MAVGWLAAARAFQLLLFFGNIAIARLLRKPARWSRVVGYHPIIRSSQKSCPRRRQPAGCRCFVNVNISALAYGMCFLAQ